MVRKHKSIKTGFTMRKNEGKPPGNPESSSPQHRKSCRFLAYFHRRKAPLAPEGASCYNTVKNRRCVYGAIHTKGHHAGLWGDAGGDALVKRCDISSNTFYYHYRDIYDLLDAWFHLELGRFTGEGTDWHTSTKAVMRECQAHPAKIYHVFNALSRDRMEQYVFSLTDDTFFRLVQQQTADSGLPQERVEEIAAFCRYAYVGFFLQFLWNRMEADIDRSVDRLGELMTAFVRSAMAEPSN